MSHYTAAKIAVSCAEDLVEGLVLAGFPREAIEVHDAPVRLYGYRGDLRETTAHVVIRRRHVGASSNDVGFLRLSDGTWQEQVSDFDRGWYRRTGVTRCRETIMQGATVARLQREAKRRGIDLEIEYQTVDGKRVASIRRAERGRARQAARGRARTATRR